MKKEDIKKLIEGVKIEEKAVFHPERGYYSEAVLAKQKTDKDSAFILSAPGKDGYIFFYIPEKRLGRVKVSKSFKDLTDLKRGHTEVRLTVPEELIPLLPDTDKELWTLCKILYLSVSQYYKGKTVILGTFHRKEEGVNGAEPPHFHFLMQDEAD